MNQNEIQKLVSGVERYVKAIAKLGRATSVTLTKNNLDGLLKGPQRKRVWQAMCSRPRGLALDVVVAFPTDRYPADDESARFNLGPGYLALETVVSDFLEQGLTDGTVSLLELDPVAWVLRPEESARVIAERVLEHQVEKCTVALPIYDPIREDMIRELVEEGLLAQGSLAAADQAQVFPVISISSLGHLRDAERWHLIIDSAHAMGTTENGKWITWAKPLRQSGLLKHVDLIAPAHLGGLAAGYNVVHHLSRENRRMSWQAQRQLCERMFDACLGYRIQYSQDALWTVGKKPVLMLWRLTSERDQNMRFARGMGPHVSHTSLFLDFAPRVKKQHEPIVVLRDLVAARFNLQDWLYVLSLLSKATLIVIRADANERTTFKVEDYLQLAKPMRTPALTL